MGDKDLLKAISDMLDSKLEPINRRLDSIDDKLGGYSETKGKVNRSIVEAST
ncbi:hypothetical protein EUAN_02540 [Andreesenia angusta]|uniref:Uncharacterized protein n=1 Tax=Andreesenia angusta TaxID=39480 RepID=A0A1S1VAE4_9FIRM|nr:hypothetical protein [Andreesenia angusta]OHW63390.1 hypothetical protein EUAN_02540 [Andreesenia angusta]